MKAKQKLISIHITSTQDLQQKLAQYELAAASNINKLVVHICEQSQREGYKTVIIKADTELMAKSYLMIPALWGRSLMNRIQYPAVQTYREGHMLVFRASSAKKALTFRARVIQGIRKHGHYQCERKDVPASYRRRPSLMSQVLENETGNRIATVATKEFIRWEVSTKLKHTRVLEAA